jgi:hypothetical protein
VRASTCSTDFFCQSQGDRKLVASRSPLFSPRATIELRVHQREKPARSGRHCCAFGAGVIGWLSPAGPARRASRGARAGPRGGHALLYAAGTPGIPAVPLILVPLETGGDTSGPHPQR